MKQVVITGVTRGLGRALADRFVEAGYRVRGCGRSADGIQSVRQVHGAPHGFEVVDVADDAGVAGWARRVIDEGGPPDFLINNAAIITPVAALWEVPRDRFDALVDVNIKGVANVIRHFVPAMVSRGSGVIVNFSSAWGRSVSPRVAPYCASKWAIEGLTRALAEELPRGMAAVPLNPGVIDTDMLRACFGEESASYFGPEEWSHLAIKTILALGPAQNGKPWSVR